MFDDRFMFRDFSCMCFVCSYDCFILSSIAIAASLSAVEGKSQFIIESTKKLPGERRPNDKKANILNATHFLTSFYCIARTFHFALFDHEFELLQPHTDTIDIRELIFLLQ